MVSDLLNDSNKNDVTKNDYDTNKILNEVIDKCCKIESNVDKNNQMLKEKYENNKKFENKVNQKDKIQNDILEKIDLKLNVMEVKIKNDFEDKNEDLKNKNIILKNRITNINKQEWTNNFSLKVNENQNHNITDSELFKTN